MQSGFTIVELLIVIVVIAILATVATVVYGGVRSRAIEASMQSDTEDAVAKIQSDKLKNGTYPANAAAIANGAGLQASEGNVFTYVLKPYGYCLAVTNPATSNAFRVKSIDGKILPGNCDVTVSTYAGSGTQGADDGASTVAQFYRPRGVAVDSKGNVFVVDSSNNRIRKIATDGTVSTYAGSTSGLTEGNISVAQFASPNGIAIDHADNIYVADVANHRIRKITPEGEVSTLAGSTSGFLNGNGSAARFASPYGVAVDKSGIVYVADTINHRIRKITPNGDVTTLAGTGTTGFTNGISTVARFASPIGVAVNDSGVVYVADTSNNRIRVINTEGVVSTLAGSASGGNVDGTGTAAQFNNPSGIAVDSAGTVYVTNTWSNRIRAITPEGVVTTIAGGTYGFADGTGAEALFNDPYGIAVDSTGNLYIGDYDNHRVRLILQ